MNLADDLVLLHLAVIGLYLGVGEHHLPIILTEKYSQDKSAHTVNICRATFSTRLHFD